MKKLDGWGIGDRYQIIEGDVILTGEITNITWDHDGFFYHVQWNDGCVTKERKISPVQPGARN